MNLQENTRLGNIRDNDKKRYMGKGVLNAVKNVNTVINDTLKGMESGDIYAIDAAMIKADGTKDKSKLGALDGITREQIDKSLTVTMGQYGEIFKRGFDLKL